MHRYYDIHTHKAPEPLDGCLAINSIYANFEQSKIIQYCSIGLHPLYQYNLSQDFVEIESYAKLPNVIAIGECGLDKLSETDMETQIKIFHLHIDLANALGKPLIIHCVRAYEELLQCLKKNPPKVPVIFHGFNKNEQLAVRIINSGYYLSFGNELLKTTNHVAGYFKNLDHTKMFLETDDSEYSIKEIYAKAAILRNIEEETLILQVQENFKTVFPKI